MKDSSHDSIEAILFAVAGMGLCFWVWTVLFKRLSRVSIFLLFFLRRREMRKYKTEKYTREDGKIVITERCTNPHWDAMPGEFDKVFLYDPVKAEQAKDWEEVYTFKTRNGRRTWMYTFLGIGMMALGWIISFLVQRGSFVGIFFAFIALAGLIITVGRNVYVGIKQNPYKCLKCPFPEDPGAF